SEHPALLERAVVVDLVEHLPIGMIEPAGKRRDDMRVGEPAARDPILREFGAARMASAAGLDLGTQRSGRAAARGGGSLGVGHPGRVASLGEALQEPHGWIVALAERPPALLRSRPRDVSRALSVTRLAAHADFREAGGEAIAAGIIILAHAGRVTLRAHEVPVLIELGPVQDIVVLDLLVRVEMEPALAAVILRPAVPG